jgi:hypothetical protein
MKQAILIRQLDNFKPVVMAVITQPHEGIIQLEGYFKSKCVEKIVDFKKKFPEFTKAAFYVQVYNMETEECSVIEEYK